MSNEIKMWDIVETISDKVYGCGNVVSRNQLRAALEAAGYILDYTSGLSRFVISKSNGFAIATQVDAIPTNAKLVQVVIHNGGSANIYVEATNA